MKTKYLKNQSLTANAKRPVSKRKFNDCGIDTAPVPTSLCVTSERAYPVMPAKFNNSSGTYGHTPTTVCVVWKERAPETYHAVP
jgi:hypothetical protein